MHILIFLVDWIFLLKQENQDNFDTFIDNVYFFMIFNTISKITLVTH